MSDKKRPTTLSWDAFRELGDPHAAELPQESASATNTNHLNAKVRIYLERKGRGGKTVSIVKGLNLSDKNLTDLAKKLKSYCGTGGYLEDNYIIIQGDQRKKILDFFISQGYSDVKDAGH